jgi:hypothetical protein
VGGLISEYVGSFGGVSLGSSASGVAGLMKSHILCFKASDSTNSMNGYQSFMSERVIANLPVVDAMVELKNGDNFRGVVELPILIGRMGDDVISANDSDWIKIEKGVT